MSRRTVPIRRTQEDEWIPHRRTQLNHSFYDSMVYAVVKLDGEYYGARASLTYGALSYGEFSLAQIWVASGPSGELNTVESGWRVTSRDNKTRLFTYWTKIKELGGKNGKKRGGDDDDEGDMDKATDKYMTHRNVKSSKKMKK
ncbi:hypothetical protein CFP56_019939 [Quercus suber]|uniref:Neprosin PEP catalytic domain-containing protein n=1 Tax=Quercus suber TaxID=58331 RepID=A0AAW0KIQ4_QUESU